MEEIILSIYPTQKGFAFVVFENEEFILNFGNSYCFDNDVLLSRIEDLIFEYNINLILLEDFSVNSKRQNKARKIVSLVKELCVKKKLKTLSISNKQVSRCFNKLNLKTKHQRAVYIANKISALSFVLPNKRKCHEPKNPAMNIFDASSLVLTYYYLKN